MIPVCILAINDENDREFMTALFLQYERLMYKEIYQITSDIWETEDILQSALVKLIDKITLLRTLDSKRLINYLISTVKNTAYNHMNRKKPAFSFDEMRDVEADDEISEFEDRMELNFQLERLANVWPLLDQRSKYVLEAYYILEKHPEEIARDLGIKANSIRMILSRARKRAYRLMAETLAK